MFAPVLLSMYMTLFAKASRRQYYYEEDQEEPSDEVKEMRERVQIGSGRMRDRIKKIDYSRKRK